MPPITPEEMKERWVGFHQEIRQMSGSRIRRVAGRILGDDTWRYHLARFIFGPFLRSWRKITKREKKTVRLVSAVHSPTVFPVNYHPRVIDYEVELAALTFDSTDVSIVEINEGSSAPSEFVAALNDTLNETTAEWLFLCDASTSQESRRYSVAKLLARATSEDDVVFADEAGINSFSPILKSPAVGPHTLLSYNVIGRPALLRVETLFAAGGFSPDAGLAYEHDAYLRLSEAKARFRHVPRVLPAGRPEGHINDTRLSSDTCRVAQAALERRGLKGHCLTWISSGLVDWSLEAPTPAPSIDIIIPTRDRIDLVRQCINSIEEKTTYPNFNVIILDNDSIEPESHEYFKETKYTVIPCPGPFNYAKIVNRGVDHSTADYVLTLNNDTIVVTPDWLEQMISVASLMMSASSGPAFSIKRGTASTRAS